MAEVTRAEATAQVRRTIGAYRDRVHEARNNTNRLPPEGARIVNEYCSFENDWQELVQDAIWETSFLDMMDDGLLLEYCAVCMELDEVFGLGSWRIGRIDRIVGNDKGVWKALQREFDKNPLINEEAMRHNLNLPPSMGKMFIMIKASLYHSARNNLVKHIALSGRNIFDDIGSAAKSTWEKTIDVANISKEAIVNTVLAGWKSITYFHFEGRKLSISNRS